MKIPQEAVPPRFHHSRLCRHRVGTIEISASRWSPVINRIVSDPLGQPPANRYLDRSVQGGSHANSRLSWEERFSSCRFAFSPSFLFSRDLLFRPTNSFAHLERQIVPIVDRQLAKNILIRVFSQQICFSSKI